MLWQVPAELQLCFQQPPAAFDACCYLAMISLTHKDTRGNRKKSVKGSGFHSPVRKGHQTGQMSASQILLSWVFIRSISNCHGYFISGDSNGNKTKDASDKKGFTPKEYLYPPAGWCPLLFHPFT